MNKQTLVPFMFILGSIFFISCQSNKETKKDIIEEPEKVSFDLYEPDLKEIATLRKCYTAIVNDLYANMNLKIEDDLVTGDLIYRNEEKTVKSGILTGEFSKDTLYVSYKYVNQNNEYIVEELIFMHDLKKHVIVQGNGKTVTNKNLIKILDVNDITFKGPVFHKYDCDQL